ncbi:hypothetical protein T440DRAFT_302203 [Plenodomus tracheiphilus IPT5]|uniref:Zn(2)-C6 fungal-type domain-containing protein n=1 Tax=Plenodomus tracheiphilus IPT5 TaxID=1408161 RepID=A0A6A7ANE4_9PLEO|nr:hypothetical protein T440DRAFT_302203 [Plenodomus tracheiphilus IPT5]
MDDARSRHPATTRTTRTKSIEACERCREKRIKCNGLRPCSQCSKRDVQCVFAYTPAPETGGTELLAQKLDLVMARLDSIEQRLISPTGLASEFRLTPQIRGITQVNQQTGCFEYYGRTSTFGIASSLGKRLRGLEDATASVPPAKQCRTELDEVAAEPLDDNPKELGLSDLTSCCDYVVPPNALRKDRCLREAIADRHLESFFDTIHTFLPILDPETFKARYSSLRKLFGDRRLLLSAPNDGSRPQFVCLMYAVLALGALYEDGQEDASSWASWYFAEAQDMLGRLLDASNLQLIQAATFLGAYAQHAIKPNLAYILTGLATRLAFSIGLNVETLHSSLGFDLQEARRTWSIIYIQEVELSLDAGRPISLRSSEMNMNYPTPKLPMEEESSTKPAQVVFIRFLAELAKVVRRILEFSNDGRQVNSDLQQREALRQQLEHWRVSLPNYLSFGGTSDQHWKSRSALSSHWQAKQQSSLRCHYNTAIITLLRKSTPNNTIEPNGTDEEVMSSMHYRASLDAARDMIEHIYRSFEVAPALRRWSYYCFYCLHGTLVLLSKVADDYAHHRRQVRTERGTGWSGPHSGSNIDTTMVEKDRFFCGLAIEIFEKIQLKASQRCADVVRQFLRKCTVQSGQRVTNGFDVPLTSSGTYLPGDAQHPSRSNGAASRSYPQSSNPSSLTQSTKIADQHEDAVIEQDITRWNSGCIGSAQGPSGSSNTSPPISLDGLQAELYDALYRNDNVLMANQLYPFNSEAFGHNQVPFSEDVNWTGSWCGCSDVRTCSHTPHQTWAMYAEDGSNQ